jgi:ligand-binding SRPBCC domain-containing protein
MPIHTLERSLTIPAGIEACWAFFSDPRNLTRITPPEMRFEVVSNLPPRMHPGMMIEYRVRPLLGIPLTWLTEITHVDEPRGFVDEQRIGPYRIWHHEHWFEKSGTDATTMHDKVTYALPFGVLGDLAHPVLVLPQLQRIFEFREKAIREVFPS